jgi:hypothetical protein
MMEALDDIAIPHSANEVQAPAQKRTQEENTTSTPLRRSARHAPPAQTEVVNLIDMDDNISMRTATPATTEALTQKNPQRWNSNPLRRSQRHAPPVQTQEADVDDNISMRDASVRSAPMHRNGAEAGAYGTPMHRNGAGAGAYSTPMHRNGTGAYNTTMHRNGAGAGAYGNPIHRNGAGAGTYSTPMHRNGTGAYNTTMHRNGASIPSPPPEDYSSQLYDIIHNKLYHVQGHENYPADDGIYKLDGKVFEVSLGKLYEVVDGQLHASDDRMYQRLNGMICEVPMDETDMRRGDYRAGGSEAEVEEDNYGDNDDSYTDRDDHYEDNSLDPEQLWPNFNSVT